LPPFAPRPRKKDRATRAVRADREFIERRLETLTSREREVLRHVVAGQLNKHIAADLGTVEKTIKVHRGRVMQKMGANIARRADPDWPTGAGITPTAAHPAHR